MTDDVSVVICTRDCVNLVRENLPIVRATLPKTEIVIVDGRSTDGTAEVARQYADIFVSDDGKGLAYARQLGVAQASKPFVLLAGSDNRISVGLVEAMRGALLADNTLAGVAPLTEVIDANSYWEKTWKRVFEYLINRKGDADIIGTPCMYRREILLRVPFDTSIKACDDTDLCLRLKSAGYRLAVIDALAQEKCALDFSEYLFRWTGYGRSDAEFYAKYKNTWSLARRIRSLTHPFRKYGMRGTWTFLKHGDILYLPGLYIALLARYYGWIRASRRRVFGRS